MDKVKSRQKSQHLNLGAQKSQRSGISYSVFQDTANELLLSSLLTVTLCQDVPFCQLCIMVVKLPSLSFSRC